MQPILTALGASRRRSLLALLITWTGAAGEGAVSPGGSMGQPPEELPDRIKAALGALSLDERDSGSRPKQSYAFWGTQPVAQFGEEASTSEVGGSGG